jgi:hypothetical protein
MQLANPLTFFILLKKAFSFMFLPLTSNYYFYNNHY